MTKVLVVDADRELGAILSFSLERAGFEALSAVDARGALRLVVEEEPAFVLLDVELDGDRGGAESVGLQFLRDLRARSRFIGIMLTGHGDENARVLGLETGADDYMTKPFSHRELVARVHAILRRQSVETLAPSSAVTYFRSGSLVLDTAAHTVSRDGRPVRLTKTEFRLLQHLMVNAGVVVPTTVLLRQVWGYTDPAGGEMVRTAIYRLRGKLGDSPTESNLLRTIPGIGFMFQPVESPVLAAAGD